MKNKILISLLIIIPIISFSQKWNEEYGSPIVVLVETNPWLMVIGSDVPTIAIYDSRNIIYKRNENETFEYYSVKMDSIEFDKMLLSLNITQDLIEMEEYIEASNWTDQPTNQIVIVSDSVYFKSVYGSIRKNKETRKKTPTEFLKVYDNLVKFKHKKEQKWLPENIEIMISEYSHSPEKSKKWPEKWPDLKSESTIERGESLYSIYLPNNYFKQFIEFQNSLNQKQAIEINGKKFYATYRFPYPNL